ncbi:MAG TPA: copper resistance CopC family protein [Stellaceae bacterium]|jgi:methionine-rich copper-binding protein CopC|nr:copper resistance CopC family protein [Stellaceae bacterium]
MRKYPFRLTLGLLLALGAGGSAAFAHAFLDHASPAVGSTLAATPPNVRIWFTQELEAAFSGIEVSDAQGVRVDSGASQFAGNLMTVALKPLPPGEYKVHWHVISVDTHATEGNFTFRVGS